MTRVAPDFESFALLHSLYPRQAAYRSFGRVPGICCPMQDAGREIVPWGSPQGSFPYFGRLTVCSRPIRVGVHTRGCSSEAGSAFHRVVGGAQTK